MTEDEAYRAVGYLAGGINGFTQKAMDVFVEQLQKQDDGAAMVEVCERLAVELTSPPNLHDVLTAYRQHPRVAAARQAATDTALTDEFGGGRIVPAPEGMQIAIDEYGRLYDRQYGQAPIPNPALAEQTIRDLDQFDERHEVWYATFAQVARAFHDDFHRARVSVEALGRRITWTNSGRLTLTPPPDMPVAPSERLTPPPAPQSAPEPPAPSERPPEPAGLLSEALGITRRLMEEDQ